MAPVVLVADPPWQFSDRLPGKGRGAAKHYQTLSWRELQRFTLPPVVATAEHAVLFLWRVAAMQREALDVAFAWDFSVKTELVWCKLTSRGADHFGMGRYVRSSHETCLIAVRGAAFPENHAVRSRFTAPVRRHSEKPDEFYRLVERLYPSSPKVEIFARTIRQGWEQHGDQLGKLGCAV